MANPRLIVHLPRICRGICCVAVAFFVAATGCDQTPPAPPAPPLPTFTIDDGDDGEAIVDKAIAALGGEGKFPAWERGYLRYAADGDDVQKGMPGSTAVIEEHFDLPDHLRRDVHITWRGRSQELSYAISTFGNWEVIEGRRLPILNPPANPSIHLFAPICDFSLILDSNPTFTRMPDEALDDGTIHACVEATTEDQEIVRFWFDKKTSLPMASRQTIDASALGETAPILSLPFAGKPGIIVTTTLSDYRQIGAFRYPMRFKVRRGDKVTHDITFEEIRFESEMDTSIFK